MGSILKDLIRVGIPPWLARKIDDDDGGQNALQRGTSGRGINTASGVGFLQGQLTSGEWMVVPSVFRLRLTGTGTVVIDSRDSLGNVTAGVANYVVNNATDQIEFPYAGDNAVEIRATSTGTATAEVI